MKRIILKTAIAAFAFLICGNAFAFTAVVSGNWTNPATWGGVGPGSTVTAQDIIIPAGITVDMDTDVSFNGIANTFTVNGTLISTGNRDLLISSGAFAGNGSATMRRLTLNSALTTYSATGPLNVHVLSNQGATIPASSNIDVLDSLDLASGSILLNSGCSMNMAMNSSVCVDNGTMVLAGGVFNTAFAYSIFYVGSTKTMGVEANSVNVQNVMVNLSSNTEDLIVNSDMIINGDLNMVSGHIVLNGNRLVLRGQYDGGSGAQFETTNGEMVIEGIIGGMNRDLDFSAGSTLTKLTIDRNATSCRLTGNLIVTDSVFMRDGTLRLMSGSTFTMGAGSVVYVEDGSFMVTGGTFDGALSYDVVYSGASHVAGVELSGAGLNNLTFDLFSGGNVVTLSTNCTVNGAFDLQRGRLDLDVFSLELAGTWNQESTTAILGSSTAVLHLHMTSVAGDTLWFDSNAHAVGDLVIETPAAGTSVVLGTELTIHNQVNFLSGKLMIGTGSVSIRTSATVIGYDDTRYFITNDTGVVYQYIDPNSSFVMVPIGTASSYSPVGLQSGANATSGRIATRVMHGVYVDGLSGQNMATWETVVDRTWVLQPSALMTTDMNVRFYWQTSAEANGFDRNNSYITHYDNMMWDTDTAEAAIAGPFSTYRAERDGFSNGGAFAVVDNSTALTVPDNAANTGISIYPVPSSDILNISMLNEQGVQFQYELLDASGKVIDTFSNSNTTNRIDLSGYAAGYYTLRIINNTDNSVTSHRVIKS